MAYQTSFKETFDMVLGASIAAVILYYMFAFPIFRFRRRYSYSSNPEKLFDKLLEKSYYDYVVEKANLSISHEQLKCLVTYEHQNYKNRPVTDGLTLGGTIMRNSGRKRQLARILAEEFGYIDRKQALKLLRLEDKYLWHLRPWWHKVLVP